MKFSLGTDALRESQTPCLVIGVVEEESMLGAAAQIVEATGGRSSNGLQSGDIDASRGCTTMLLNPTGISAERILVTGFGEREKLDPSRFEQSCMDAGKFLRDHAVTKAHCCLADV
jgi:leucyl aminopeptidase